MYVFKHILSGVNGIYFMRQFNILFEYYATLERVNTSWA
jgi:hypothetical protein